MKKRLLSMFLVLTMMLTLMPAGMITASAEEMTTYYVSASGNDSNAGTESEPFKTIGEALKKTDGSYTIKLLSDMDENVVIEEGKNVTIDLNNHILKGDGTSSVITNNGTLKVCDTAGSKTTYYFTDSKCAHGKTVGEACESCSGGTAIKDGCFETLETSYDTSGKAEGVDYIKVTGGVITGGAGTSLSDTSIGLPIAGNYGGGIINKGTLVVTGGNIAGNSCSHGGGIANIGSTAEADVKNCVICGNKATKSGGGMYNTNGTFKADAVAFLYNVADQGGGTYNDSVNGKGIFIAVNTTISNNTGLNFGGGAYNCAGSEIILGGDTRIIDNTASNLYLSGSLLTIGDGTNCQVPGNSMKIGVIMPGKGGPRPGQFTTNGTVYDAKYFFSDSDKYDIVFVRGKKTLAETDSLYNDHLETGTAVAEVDFGTAVKPEKVKFKTIQDAVDEAAKGITEEANARTAKLLKDVDVNVSVKILPSQIAGLDLNGHVLKGDGTDRLVYNKGTLTIKDSDFEKAAENRAVHYFTYSKDSVWGYIDEPNDDQKTAAVTLDNIKEDTTVVKVTGGVITGGGYNGYGGGVFSESGSSLKAISVNIIGNKADWGGGISNDGSCIATNALIAGNSAEQGGGVVNQYESLVMNNVTVSHNSATLWGGGIFNDDSEGASLEMYGGSITDNIITNTDGEIYDDFGGAGIDQYGVMTIGEDAVIKNNKTNGQLDNLWCDSSKLTLASGEKALKSGAEIYINCGTDTGIITTNGAATDAKYFTSDSLAYKVNFNEGTGAGGYLELVNYEISKVASDTVTASLEKDNMTLEQAKAIAKVQKVHTGLGKETIIAYAKGDSFASDSKYKVIKASSTSDWSEGTAMTLAQMKADISNKDYFVIGKATGHVHSFTYALSKTTSDNDTVTATCSGAGTCAATDNKLTIVKPELTTYGETSKSASATLGSATTFIGGNLPAIKYEKKNAGNTYSELTAAPTDAGNYKASITVGSGEKAKTAYVEYTIDKAIQSKTVGDIIEDSNTNNSITVKELTVSGETVEYAISKENKEPTTGWQTSNTFTGLKGNTQYYIFARVKESDNYKAGPASSLAAMIESSVVCTYSTCLTAGTFLTLMLGGNEAGKVTITGDSCKGFILQNEDGTYIAYEDGKVNTKSTSSYTWKYDGGLYAESKTSSKCGCWCWGSFFSKSAKSSKTTKSYLAYSDGMYDLSSNKVEAKVLIEALEHEIGYRDNGDTHTKYCRKCGEDIDTKDHEYDKDTGKCECGKENPALGGVTNVKVCEKQTSSCCGWFFFKKKSTKYQYTISPVTKNVCVKEITYSMDGQTVWNKGSSFTSDKKLSEFYIKVTDSNGNETTWKYLNGTVEKYQTGHKVHFIFNNVPGEATVTGLDANKDMEVPDGADIEITGRGTTNVTITFTKGSEVKTFTIDIDRTACGFNVDCEADSVTEDMDIYITFAS